MGEIHPQQQRCNFEAPVGSTLPTRPIPPFPRFGSKVISVGGTDYEHFGGGENNNEVMKGSWKVLGGEVCDRITLKS